MFKKKLKKMRYPDGLIFDPYNPDKKTSDLTEENHSKANRFNKALDKNAIKNINNVFFKYDVPYTFIPKIKDVLFSDRATIIFWEDSTKTVVKCHKEDSYDPYTGFAMAIVKKLADNSSAKLFEVFTEMDG